jgi:Zn ribbon nucleic-acid-binding protein
MKCPQCKIVEMLVTKVKNNTIYHKCKQCGREEQEEIKKVIKVEP